MKNTISHMMALAFLISIAPRLSASLQKLVLGPDGTGQTPQITLNPVDLYIKKNISSAANTVPLLDANTRKLNGVVSFDANGKLDQNRAVIFDKIFVGFKTDAAADKEGALVYDAAPDPALYNADLEIVQDGRVVFKRNVSSLINSGAPASLDDLFAKSENLRYLIDNENVEINLKFPDGVAMPAAATANQYIFVKLSGLETERKTFI